MATRQSTKQIKLIGQIAVSVIGLAGGVYICAACPDLRVWGASMIAGIVGYWLK